MLATCVTVSFIQNSVNIDEIYSPVIEHIKRGTNSCKGRIVRAMQKDLHRVRIALARSLLHLGRNVRQQTAHAQPPDLVRRIYHTHTIS